MDEFSNGYQPDENYGGTINLEEGDYKMRIQNILFNPTKNGDPMITAELTVSEAPIVFKHYIVKNEYFNSNMTKFFDCFKIPRGNFEYQRWIGRIGKAHIAKGEIKANGKAYWEIAYLVADKPSTPGQQASTPSSAPAQAQSPRQATPAPQQSNGAMPFDDDIPF